MFAEDLEDEIIIEDEFIDDGEDLEDEPVDEPEDFEDDSEPEDDEDDNLDSKTRAIIKQKKENKRLKRELEEKQQRLDQIELEKETDKRVIELTKQGKDTEEATRIAKEEVEVRQLKLQLARMELSNLENKYPGISAYAKELIADKAKLPDFSYEQIYRAKYAKSSEYDTRTKLEQEIAYQQREARSKGLEGSNAKQTKQVTLSPKDERIYLSLKRNMPGLTRKRFKELSESESLE